MSLLGPHLLAFLAIVRRRTVLAAAKEIGITQTGVTQRLRSLETELDATLFTRSRHGMRLTHEGEALLRYCQNTLDLEGKTLAQIKGAGKKTEVRVAVLGPTSIMRTRTVPQLLRVLKDFPEVLFSFEISDNRNGADALKAGQVQFAIIPEEEVARELDSKRLQPEHYVLVGRREWRNRDIEDVVAKERIIDFDASDQMTYSYLKKFNLLRLARPERHFVNNNESLLQMFEAGSGYGVLTREFAARYSKQYEISILNTGCFIENRLALAWYPRTHSNEYFQSIIRALR